MTSSPLHWLTPDTVLTPDTLLAADPPSAPAVPLTVRGPHGALRGFAALRAPAPRRGGAALSVTPGASVALSVTPAATVTLTVIVADEEE